MAKDREDDARPAALPWLPLLPWQEEIARDTLAQRATWPSALLIHGRRGIGKHGLALNYAQALLCESPRPDGVACGTCASCRYAVAGQHPDLMRLTLSEWNADDDAFVPVETISIKRIRDLIDFAQVTSHRQRAKVAVIAPAERMNPQAANALLKTLEEPPPGTYLILASDQPGRLPATIRSRCRQQAAPLPDRDAAIAWLTAQGVHDAPAVLAQAGGAPLLALEIADPAWQNERRVWLAALAQPSRLGVIALAARVDAGPKEERRARLAHAIDWLIAWTADLARAAAGASPQQNPDYAREVSALSGKVAPPALFRYHDLLLQQRALLAHPLQLRAVAEAALIDYRALFN